MTIDRKFPSTRLRRLRLNSSIQNLVAETQLMKTDLIQPIFIKEGLKGIEQIESLPSINRYGSDAVLNEVEDLANLNIGAIAIFPVIDPTKKDNHGSEATNDNNFLINEIKKIKAEFPEMLLISDVALDPYTTHGHDGILDESGYVDNDKTLKILRDQSLILAEAGADIIAPSDMMDGRVGVIRDALEKNGFINTIILSYAAKYNSQFYGPFRDAVGSSANLGKSSKSSYQMAFTNSDEALYEVALDIKEGADIVMVKPGMPYLDIIYRIKQEFKIPTFAYQVSGEYSMIKNAIEKGWIDRGVMLESLTSLKRAGSDAILTYAAKEISKELL
jgi:porphobilinogen synthase